MPGQASNPPSANGQQRYANPPKRVKGTSPSLQIAIEVDAEGFLHDFLETFLNPSSIRNQFPLNDRLPKRLPRQKKKGRPKAAREEFEAGFCLEIATHAAMR